MRGVIGGATGSTAKITGSLERLVRNVTGTSRRRGAGEQANLLQDFAELGAGIIDMPRAGAARGGLLGFTRGVGTGLVSVVTAPLVGTLMVTTELLNTVHEHVQFEDGGGRNVRVRPARADDACAPLLPLAECMITHLCVRVVGAAHGGPVPTSAGGGAIVCSVLVGSQLKLKTSCPLSEWPSGMRWPQPLLVRVHALSQPLVLQLTHLPSGQRQGTPVGACEVSMAEARQLAAQAELAAAEDPLRRPRVWCARAHRARRRPRRQRSGARDRLHTRARAERAACPPARRARRVPITHTGALATAYLQVQIAVCDGTREPVAWAAGSVAAMADPTEQGSLPGRLPSASQPAYAPRRVSVSVNSHRILKERSMFERHVVYVVVVALGDERWEVARRFSDFRRLHDELTRSFPLSMRAAAAQIPHKEVLPTLRDKELEASRRMPHLQQYVQWLMLNDDTRRSPPLMQFLEVQQRGHSETWLQSVGSVGGQNAAMLSWSGSGAGASNSESPRPVSNARAPALLT